MSLADALAAAAATPSNGGAANKDFHASAAAAASSPEDARVQEVLSSEIGVATMLNRLKQSIASAKEFALFLKKRALLEEDHANGLKKLCRTSHDSVDRSDQLGGSFAKAYIDMTAVHERFAENGLQFAASLVQMHEDLIELAAIAEKSRKGWKQNGMTAEQKVADLEAAMRKSKAKYDALADEYDRVRTGDTSGGGGGKGGKMFSFKGPKSASQHEEDLLRKTQLADQDYRAKVETAQTERHELVTKTRPETVAALRDIASKCDAGLTLQLQKFASFNEKLLLSNGLCISPLKSKPGEAVSLRENIQAVNTERDMNEYIVAHHAKIPHRSSEPRYERNPVLDQSINRSQPMVHAGNHAASPLPQPQPNQQPPTPLSMNLPGMPNAGGPGGYENMSPTTYAGRPGHSYGASMTSPLSASGPGPQRHDTGHERSVSHGSAAGPAYSPPYPTARGSGSGPVPVQPPLPQPHSQQGPPGSRLPGSSGSTGASNSGAPQLAALSFETSQNPTPLVPEQARGQSLSEQGGGGPYASAYQKPHMPSLPATLPSGPAQGLPMHPAQGRNPSPPRSARPVFGVSLSRLYERDGLAVPMVVYQCIQAVDLFGLSVEGIYRLSGSVPHVNKLKNMFDTDSTSANLDFRNPENFFHDVNSVAGLLKQFFRDLPDPLLTREHYAEFIEAAKHDDETLRRDSLHAIINNLPDPNYATLRALTLHLARVVENSGTNRMTNQNLAIVFGPTLMGQPPGANIADAGWQLRVVDTILQNTYQIFDDD